MARRSHPSEGFAYLWLLFTVAFMGVGLVVVAEVHAVAQQRDKERELLAIGHQFREALRRYQERSGPLPGGGRACPRPPERRWALARHRVRRRSHRQ